MLPLDPQVAIGLRPTERFYLVNYYNYIYKLVVKLINIFIPHLLDISPLASTARPPR